MGSLYDILHKKRIPITNQQMMDIILDIAIGLCFLHSSRPPIIHRDLKVNIAVDLCVNYRV